MGREVRRVPADWQHPKEWRWDHRGNRVERYKPLYPGENYQSRVDEWDEECAKWKTGWRPDHCDDAESRAMAYEQWAGQRPHKDDYMPDWPAERRTHLMMYEDTSEGTPISPAFATPEELARWLADNGASSFGSDTATYEQWLRVAQGGWAPSMVYTPQTGLVSGVHAYAAAAVAAERERCAKLCDALVDGQDRYGDAEYSAGAAECARRIRAAAAMATEQTQPDGAASR